MWERGGTYLQTLIDSFIHVLFYTFIACRGTYKVHAAHTRHTHTHLAVGTSTVAMLGLCAYERLREKYSFIIHSKNNYSFLQDLQKDIESFESCMPQSKGIKTGVLQPEALTPKLYALKPEPETPNPKAIVQPMGRRAPYAQNSLLWEAGKGRFNHGGFRV